MMRLAVLSVALLLPRAVVPAQQSKPAGHWDSWQFLVGEWVGEGGGQPGQGTGSFSFRFELQGKVLVRRNRSDYPAAKDRPAYSHEDLMIVYPDPGGNSMRAVYFDNEGQVIHYTAQFSPDQKTLTFLSDVAPGAPRFRLTYTKSGGATLGLKFDIAPPGKPDSFSTYIEAVCRKKAD
ncbi:MAG: hypothetical protein HY236_06945 [Acidobacteria bacterium]|nr:hypothetical protein [Acidobacteriota bacterium]